MTEDEEWKPELLARAYETYAVGEGDVSFSVRTVDGERRVTITGGPTWRGAEKQKLQKKLDKV